MLHPLRCVFIFLIRGIADTAGSVFPADEASIPIKVCRDTAGLPVARANIPSVEPIGTRNSRKTSVAMAYMDAVIYQRVKDVSAEF